MGEARREIEKKKQWQMGVGEAMKYTGQGFMFGSAVTFFIHQHFKRSASSVRQGLVCAGRLGMLAAFRTPLFVCIERTVAASRGGQTDHVSLLGALYASHLAKLPTIGWLFYRASTAKHYHVPTQSKAEHILLYLLNDYHWGKIKHATGFLPGAGGFFYWLFLGSLLREHNQRRNNDTADTNVVLDHGFNPGFLQDF